MIPDLAYLLDLQANTYLAQPEGEVYDAGPDRVVLTRSEGRIDIAIRGTQNPLGWQSDFQIEPRIHPILGIGHRGLMDGSDGLWEMIRDKVITDPAVKVRVIGHSRGAGEVPWIVGYLLEAGITPDYALAIEKPWTCGLKLKGRILAAGVPGAELWHGDDPVPAAPALAWLVPNVWPVVHFGEPTLDPFDCHHLPGIIADQGLVI